MRRVLVVHPYLASAGGSNAVAAWAIEALRGEFEVSLATLKPIDLAAVNRSFGTSLRPSDFRCYLAPERYLRMLRLIRNPGALLDCQLTVRHARNLDRGLEFDILLSTHNEVDFGRRGIQYVNFPAAYVPRPGDPQRFSHHIPGLHAAFRAFCYRVGRVSKGGIGRNVFIADSHHIQSEIREIYGVDSMVLYPPVSQIFPHISWEQRKSSFVAVGRISTPKRWEMAIEIIEGVRAKGHNTGLTLIGHRENSKLEAKLRGLAATRPWFRMLHDVSRQELAREIASHRYGLHTMRGEHFGIAPAEILSAGCLPFVHNSGGPVEIVGHPGLRFEHCGEAVDKISSLLTNPDLERRLREHTAVQKRKFSTEVFCRGLRDILSSFR